MSSRIEEKLRAQGYDPEKIKASMRNYIGEGRAFATPQEYAATIQEKRAAGEQLQDPVTARAFESIAPSHFGGPKTEFHFGGGTIPDIPGLDPTVQSLLSAVSQYQADHPISIPFAPGTPTGWQLRDQEAIRQAEEAERQWAERMEFDRHKLGLDEQFRRDQLAQQLALARMSRAGVGGAAPSISPEEVQRETIRSISAGTGVPMIWDVYNPPVEVQAYINDLMYEDPYERIRAMVEFGIQQGNTWDDIQRAIYDDAPRLRNEKVDVNTALQWAFDHFEKVKYDQSWDMPIMDRLRNIGNLYRDIGGAMRTATEERRRLPLQEAIDREWIKDRAKWD